MCVVVWWCGGVVVCGVSRVVLWCVVWCVVCGVVVVVVVVEVVDSWWWVVGWVGCQGQTFSHHRQATDSPTTRGPRTSSVAICGMRSAESEGTQSDVHSSDSAIRQRSVERFRAPELTSISPSLKRVRFFVFSGVLQATVNCLELEFQKGKHFKFPVLNCTIFRHKDDSTGSCVHTSVHAFDGADDAAEFMDSSCARGI